MAVQYELLRQSAGGARAGVLHTRRGAVPTPVFMPVATHAAFRHLSMDDARSVGAPVLLANTYHLMLRPGPDVLRSFGGVHGFMDWNGPVLTDSGGFQIFSLATECTITEKGAHFRASHDNNARHVLTPEKSIEIQKAINSDIMMVLDVCIDSTSDEKATRHAMERTHRWAMRSLEAADNHRAGQALFAIIQGGVHPHLREASAAFLTDKPFDGFAIGGLAVGESKREREDMTEKTTALMPAGKPRYLMGVGTPVDLIEAVRRGVDMFDCILPTKMAQQGYAYTFNGIVKLWPPANRLVEKPIEDGCDCSTCRKVSRAYINHLLRSGQHTGARFISIHNVRFYQRLMSRIRAAILEGTFDYYASDWIARLTPARAKSKSIPA